MASTRDKSKRLSAGKPEQLRLDDFVLYLDENLDNCKPIVQALVESTVRFERHADHFQRGERDEVWLSFIGKNGWAVLTKDKRNRYNEWERYAIQQNRVREFYFGSGNFNAEEMAAALRAALPEMRRIFRSEGPPFVCSITRSGAVTVLFDQHGSTHERRRAQKPSPTKPK